MLDIFFRPLYFPLCTQRNDITRKPGIRSGEMYKSERSGLGATFVIPECPSAFVLRTTPTEAVDADGRNYQLGPGILHMPVIAHIEAGQLEVVGIGAAGH